MNCKRPSDHDWHPMKRGSDRVRCLKCHTVFPCTHACQHIDCIDARGEPLPEWVTVVYDNENNESEGSTKP